MKSKIIIVSLSFLVMAALLFPLACSPQDEERLARKAPSLAPATRMAEDLQAKLDPMAAGAQRGAAAVRDAADTAAQLGVPGASAVAFIAGAIGTLLGLYNERRRNTIPLRSAVEQIVQSVESAFPEKSPAQKAALAAAQDHATRRLVSSLKKR